MSAAETRLKAVLAGELEGADHLPAAAFAAELARIGRAGVAAVLFYGSALRTKATEGVLDFYVLVDDLAAWPQPKLAARAGGWLPPNVEYREWDFGDQRLRAKIAVLTTAQFRRHAGRDSLDTSIWARFAQPAGLLWFRDETARGDAIDAVAEAAQTAAWWAAVLGPTIGPAEDFWDALFRETYATELRVDWKGRAGTIVGAAGERYAALLPLAWAASALPFERDGSTLRPLLYDRQRQEALRRWRSRRRAGKPLTVLRLAKAVFTFAGAADYAAWKIERHTGVKIDVTPWKRRHPFLAAPGVAWRLWRKGVLK